MSNPVTFEDFYQVPDLSFDINKLRQGKHVEKTKASHEFCIDYASSVPVKVFTV